jgi:SPP1 family predicted phage head-tail adaptor
MTDTLTLITQAITIDDYGNEVATETEKVVFCEVDSITQSEFFQAANTELNPEYKFTVFFGDYDGQPIVEYHDVRYAIYRTYRADDNLELYAERKIGA